MMNLFEEKTIECAGVKHTLFIPKQDEELVEKYWSKHQNEDQFFPFWMAAWNGVFALNVWLRKQKIETHHTLLEVGGGGGILAQLLANLDCTIYHTDLVPDAVAQTQKIMQNKSPHPRAYFALDLNEDPLKNPISKVIGAEIFYDDLIVRFFCEFLKQKLVQTQDGEAGVAWVAEPIRFARKHNSSLIRSLWPHEYTVHSLQLELNGVQTEFVVHEFKKF
jgi:hypothetical protein